MDLRLAGKTAVVTGGSKGIGLDVVRVLLGEGVKVVSGSRTITPGLKETGAYAVTVDLSTPDGPRRLIDEAVEHFGGIDVLINNVGIGDSDTLVDGATQTLLTLPDNAWQDALDLHFYSALRATRAALPSLIERKGVVVNVSSIGARIVGTGPANYNVSKIALNALTKITAEQFGAQGVRAVTVSPGPVETGVWTDEDGFVSKVAKIQGTTHEEFRRQFLDQLGAATGRVSTAEEVARLIVFAASPNNITGADFLIDGGVVKAA
ncbi:SDR family oxidoreductase [Kibdelosporangium persicum]|uniref:NADP-dependent 3-hydroxy acid dehydrogenase YdfG n=1 Tax=Kibdelosporangium persicum TaxID=2698649 RepID=A0ABX2EV95_9PSEU|nr:SDR family oxidoreductase [Kibdelosporangium persicum]NRN62868.1 NADP-dependent 3-hydroxy acid dehydrogenase YdfG [Kibdelosporangium persicum]